MAQSVVAAIRIDARLMALLRPKSSSFLQDGAGGRRARFDAPVAAANGSTGPAPPVRFDDMTVKLATRPSAADRPIAGAADRSQMREAKPQARPANRSESWFFPRILLENLLIVTAMSFDTVAIIDHNGTVLNAAQIASRSAPQPYLRRMMDKTRADNNGSGATALMHRRVK
jgi:hypothetical protein